MAIYDGDLTSFVKSFGEQAVVSALKAYVSGRARMAKYAEKNAAKRKEKAAERKEESAFAKQIAAAARTPEGAAKVRELLAQRGINL